MRRRRAALLAAALTAAGPRLLVGAEGVVGSATPPAAATAPSEGVTAPAPNGPHVAIAAGVIEVVDPQPRAFVSFAWQDRHGARRASPWISAEATRRDTMFGFGALIDLPVGRGCLVTPSVGAVLYHEHDGLGLGSMFEFRPSIQVTWPLGTGRFGAALVHFSNAGIGAHNPGSEAVMLVWETPLARRVSRSSGG